MLIGIRTFSPACAAIAYGIERDTFGGCLRAAVCIALIALEVAGRDIHTVELATTGVSKFKGIIVAIIEAAAAEPLIEKRNAFFLIIARGAYLLIFTTLFELALISIRRENLTAIAILASVGLASDAVFHHMNIAGSLILGIVTAEPAIERAPYFTLAARAFALFAERISRLAILAFVIVAREIRAGACPSGTAMRAARFRSHAFAITKDIAIGAATVIAFILVIQAFGAAISRRTVLPSITARFCATRLDIGGTDAFKVFTVLFAIGCALDLVERTLRDKLIL